MKTILYVDGFNLYYSALKDTPHRWLDPTALAARAFPKNQIVATKFFSAKVTALAGNPQQPMRQMMLLAGAAHVASTEHHRRGLPHSEGSCESGHAAAEHYRDIQDGGEGIGRELGGPFADGWLSRPLRRGHCDYGRFGFGDTHSHGSLAALEASRRAQSAAAFGSELSRGAPKCGPSTRGVFLPEWCLVEPAHQCSVSAFACRRSRRFH